MQMPILSLQKMGMRVLLQEMSICKAHRDGVRVRTIQEGGIIMIPCIITGAVCTLVSGAIGTAVMALLSFRKLTEYEEEILKLRRRVAELEEKE